MYAPHQFSVDKQTQTLHKSAEHLLYLSILSASFICLEQIICTINMWIHFIDTYSTEGLIKKPIQGVQEEKNLLSCCVFVAFLGQCCREIALKSYCLLERLKRKEIGDLGDEGRGAAGENNKTENCGTTCIIA